MELSSNTPLKVFVITTGNEERVNRIQNYLKGIDFEFVYSDSYDDLLKLEEYESYSHKFRQKRSWLERLVALRHTLKHGN